MSIKIKESSLIRNLDGHYYNFYLSKNNKLMINRFDDSNIFMDTSLVSDEYMLDFSTFIDENDKVHLIYLLKDGSLIYSTYTNDKWFKSLIGKLNLKSNIYNGFSLYVIDNVIYVFYAHTNLINKNVWTLEMIIGDKTGWNKKRIETILSEKLFSSFYIDYDRIGNIHFVYTAKKENVNQIYYTFYNTYLKSLNQIPLQLSNSDTDNLFPYLFVDSKDNIHVLWYTLKNKDYELSYKKFSLNGLDKYRWKDINLPSIKNCIYTPIMLESKDTLKIICLKNETINALYSLDGGKCWNIDNEIQLTSEHIHFIKYTSNFKKDYFSGKATNFYCKIDDKIFFYFNDIYNNKSKINTKKELEILESSDKNIEKSSAASDTTEVNNLNELKESIVEINDLIKQIQKSIDSIVDDMIILKKKIEKEDKVTFLKKLSNIFK